MWLGKCQEASHVSPRGWIKKKVTHLLAIKKMQRHKHKFMSQLMKTSKYLSILNLQLQGRQHRKRQHFISPKNSLGLQIKIVTLGASFPISPSGGPTTSQRGQPFHMGVQINNMF